MTEKWFKKYITSDFCHVHPTALDKNQISRIIFVTLSGAFVNIKQEVL